jgi:hypothetical protein
LSEAKTVVFLVSADPKPGDNVAFAYSNCAVVIANSNNADPIAPLLKLKRRVVGIAFQKGTFRGRVFGPPVAALRSVSKNAGAFCRSRQVFEFVGANIFADLIERERVHSIFDFSKTHRQEIIRFAICNQLMLKSEDRRQPPQIILADASCIALRRFRAGIGRAETRTGK